MQRAGVSVENSISCICCGGRFVYPGGRYREHLAREHKVSGQALQFLFEASLHRKQHSSLPIISSDPNQNSPCGSKTALTKSAQSEETDIKVEPGYQTAEYLTVTPDIHGFPEKIKHPLPPPAAQVGTPLSSDLHCYFDCGHYLPPSKSMEMEIHLKLKHSKESPEDLVKAREFLKWEKSITKRSMSVYRCAVCSATLEGVSSFYDHIRKHGLEWAQYKLEFGSSCVKSSNFKCKICSRVVKYESSTVQKHLKNVHRISWQQYVNRLRMEWKGLQQEPLPEIECDTCRVCSKRVKFLKEHLKVHKITMDEYKLYCDDDEHSMEVETAPEIKTEIGQYELVKVKQERKKEKWIVGNYVELLESSKSNTEKRPLKLRLEKLSRAGREDGGEAAEEGH